MKPAHIPQHRLLLAENRDAGILGPREADDLITIRPIAEQENELMSLLTARLFLDTISFSYQGYITPENLAGRNVWDEAKECNEWLARAGGRMVVALRDGQLLGYAAYCPNEGEPGEYDWSLEGFFVLPGHQGGGLGTRLLAAAADDMAAAGAVKLVVATFSGSPAERYYQNTGATRLFITSNEHFGKTNEVSFLGWEIGALRTHLAAKLSEWSGPAEA